MNHVRSMLDILDFFFYLGCNVFVFDDLGVGGGILGNDRNSVRGERGLVDPDADEELSAVVDRPPELEGMCTL